MVYKTLYRRCKRKLERQNRRAGIWRDQARYLRKIVTALMKRVALLEDGYVVSWCCHCETQVTMLWDTEKDGLSAYCPHCGSPMMLCDYCQGNCDYNYGNDTCKEM